MTDATSHSPVPHEEPLLDQLLREAVPEIKLALGDLIDRDNARSLPDRYARLLPETVLVVTLRPDAAHSLSPVAEQLEGELTDSCMRHGSLYDRPYRVRLHEAGDPGAPLFRISKEAPGGPADRPGLTESGATPPPAASLGTVAAAPFAPPVAPIEARGETIAVPPPRTVAPPPAPKPAPAPAPAPAPVFDDPDATRMEGIAPAARDAPGWDATKWELVVEDADGADAERFPVTAAEVTVGRHTDNPQLQSDLMLSGAPQVSRRHLVLRWAPRDGAPGFQVANLGLNALHVEDAEIAGANLKGPYRLEDVPERHTRWVPADARMRIGENGPILRVRAAAVAAPDGDAGPEDPEATRFG
ncbi:MAG TPA: FHA domain-containing protein [Longimicrobium sp.]|jgi:hypothetical protein